METPMISVVVPVYNVEAFLPQCLDSIVQQTYRKIEIILVDDGSTDKSGEICDAYELKDDRIIVEHKKNGGLVSARKQGLKRATGEYVICVDSDDWIDVDLLEKIVVDIQEKDNPDMIAYGCIEEYTDNKIIRKNNLPEKLYKGKELSELQNHMLMSDNFFEWIILPHLWNKVIKRQLLVECQKNVPDVVSFGEDVACVFPCILLAKTISVLDIVPYHYRQRQGSIVKSGREIDRGNIIGIYHVLKDNFSDKENLKMQLKYYMFFILCLKGYSLIESNMSLFPFQKVKQNSRVVVYCAGGFGKVIEQFIRSSWNVQLVAWVDKQAETYRKQGMNVITIDELQDVDFDCLVIAILNEKVALEIKKELVGRGISEEKIDYVQKEIIRLQKLPSWLIE